MNDMLAAIDKADIIVLVAPLYDDTSPAIVVKTMEAMARNSGKYANSSFDDFAFKFDPATKEGYISSNRDGGFGSDDVSRTKLVKLAMKKAEENFGFEFDDNIFLFGDTPRDMDAGNEAGVITIGVATGNYSKRDLENTSADYVVDNLQDTKKILNLVLKL